MTKSKKQPLLAPILAIWSDHVYDDIMIRIIYPVSGKVEVLTGAFGTDWHPSLFTYNEVMSVLHTAELIEYLK